MPKMHQNTFGAGLAIAAIEKILLLRQGGTEI